MEDEDAFIEETSCGLFSSLMDDSWQGFMDEQGIT
jgi:hypothetical protein